MKRLIQISTLFLLLILNFNPDVYIKSLTIFNGLGEIVHSEFKNQSSLKIGHLGQGVYWIKLITESGNEHFEKLIISK